MNLQMFKNKKWLFMLLVGFSFFLFAYLMRPVLGYYIEQIPAGSAYDFVLDALPVISSDWIIDIYVYLMKFAMIFLIVTLFYYKTEDVPYAGFVFAFAKILTCIMFTLTVFGPPHNFVNSWLSWDFNKDLIPSMHVGAPLLGFLLSDKKWLKIIFFIILLIMIVVILLMHTHYTVDAIAAVFVYYGLFMLCEKYLKNLLRKFYQ